MPRNTMVDLLGKPVTLRNLLFQLFKIFPRNGMNKLEISVSCIGLAEPPAESTFH